MTVYADLLFIVNLYIDALLLSAVRRFLRLPLTGKRLLLASVLGGVFGLSALLPALPGLFCFRWRCWNRWRCARRRLRQSR